MKQLIIFICCFYTLNFAQSDETWKVFDDSEVGEIRITVDPQILEQMYVDVYSDSLHPASFYLKNSILEESVDTVGFRLRGRTSRVSEKKSFKITFNAFEKGRNFYGLQKMNLNGEHNDPAIVRSKLCWDLYSLIGMKSTRANHYALYINDEYYGLYINVEHIDDTFIERNYTDEVGNLWKCTYPADLTYRGANPDSYKFIENNTKVYDLKTNEADDDYSKLAFFIYALNFYNSEQFEEFAMQAMDVASFIKYFGMNVLVGSWDDYWFLSSNYYIYHNPADNKFSIIPYDYDNTFGVDWFTKDWSRIDPYSFAIIGGDRPLVDQLFSVQKFRNLYTHFLELNNENLLNEVLTGYYLNQWQGKLEPFADNDVFRTLDYGFTMDDFRSSFGMAPYSKSHVKNSIGQFVTNRYISLQTQLEYSDSEPVIYELDYYPKNPEPDDSIYVEVSAFGYPEIIDASILYHPGDLTVIEQYDMKFMPIAGSKVPKELDRYIGVIPPLGPLGKGKFNVVTRNSVGLSKEYPYKSLIEISTGAALTGEVLINELMARNDSTIADEDGEYDDWVELYNPNNYTVDLSGKFLTDSRNNLTKWSFPNGTQIPASGVLLIWCDDDTTDGNLHTNFKLDGDGEFIAILESDSITFVDSTSFDEQRVDISWGRDINDINKWGFMEPTPNSLNTVVGVDDEINIPVEFDLAAYPNPFNPSTTIAYSISVVDALSLPDRQTGGVEGQNVTLKIYDMLGREVETLINKSQRPGMYQIKWNASSFSSGVYIAQLKTDNQISSIKLMLIK
jgi:spore coat protein H